MPTETGHTRAICASKVKGTAVLNSSGEKIGHIEDVVLDKLSNNIMFAAVGFGGVLGMGEKYHPVPWSILKYEEGVDGYVLPIDRQELEASPSYSMDDLIRDDGAVRDRSFAHFQVQRNWQ